MDNQQELFTIVDEKDTILTYRTRYDCHNDPSLIHRSAKILLYVDDDHVWLQKRSEQKDLFPGFYTLSASGHVNKGETYERAIQREMMEEIGIKTQATHVKTFIVRLDQESEMVALFTGKYNGEFQINRDEVSKMIKQPIKDLHMIKSKLTPTSIIALETLQIL